MVSGGISRDPSLESNAHPAQQNTHRMEYQNQRDRKASLRAIAEPHIDHFTAGGNSPRLWSLAVRNENSPPKFPAAAPIVELLPEWERSPAAEPASRARAVYRTILMSEHLVLEAQPCECVHQIGRHLKPS